MPKATLTIGGPLTMDGLQMLSEAMSRDGLPLTDDIDDGGYQAVEPPLTSEGVADVSFYREALLRANGDATAICLGAIDAKDDITETASATLRIADRLGLATRTYQPGTWDDDFGEPRDSLITIMGAAAPVRGTAWVDSNGDPMLPLQRVDVTMPEAFALRYADAVKAWEVVNAEIPQIDLLM